METETVLHMMMALTAYGETTMAEWKIHDGFRDPPIPGDARVEVEFRDGDKRVGVMHDWDQNWQWQGSEEGRTTSGAILRYRVLK